MTIDGAGDAGRNEPDGERTRLKPSAVTRATQAELILGAIEDAAAWPPGSDTTGETEFFYRRDTLLVRDWHLGAVPELLRENGVGVEADELPGSLTRLRVSTDMPAPALVRWFETGEDPTRGREDRPTRLLPPGILAPEHLLYTCGVHACAATEPDPVAPHGPPSPAVDRPGPGPAGAGLGGGVRVVIVDTGLVEGAAEQHSWLVGVTGDVDQPVGADGTLMQDGGHGTFTAGCLRAAAPRAQVRVVDGTRLLTRRADAVGTIGAAYEGDLAHLIRAGLTDAAGRLDVPDVLLVNFAGPTLDERPPTALTALHDDLLQHLRELLVVAPAGNEGDTTRNWPAAFPWVVGVGAVGANWRDRATWSNHGPTTDVFAPGEDIVNAFASGTYVYAWAGPRQGSSAAFTGLARWSGTSFAAPLVAGLVATRMSSSGRTSRRAWASLLDLAESQAVSGTGPVLYPGQR